MYMTGVNPKGYADPEQVVWMRPEDYANERPQFIDDGVGANDVKQGQIGDCWLIGALSVLAVRDELLRGGTKKIEKQGEEIGPELANSFYKGVYPPIFHMYRKKNLYVLRFYKNFKWRYVIIDDRLPVFRGNCSPVFGRCSSLHELWVPLIEKAYAKLHGCYETLISGFLDDGLTDLTGLVSTKMKLHDNNGNFPDKQLAKFGDKDGIWNFLKQRDLDGCMMGCSVVGDVEREVE